MLPRPNDKTRLCLDTKCAKRETCWRYVRGGNITVGEFFDHEWLQDCTDYKHYIDIRFCRL